MISVVILTLNEELHLARCLESISKISDDIHIVDSNSSDRTLDIASDYNAKIFSNSWPGSHSKQLNIALSHIDFKHEWILRIDADEYLSDDLILEIERKLSSVKDDVNGFFMKRRVVFNERIIRFGSLRSTKILRLWRRGFAECQDKIMDEHMVLNRGRTEQFESFFYDHNLKGMTQWIEKHNDYSTKEAYQELSGCYTTRENGLGKYIYARSPLFLRSIAFFFVKYIFFLGFMDGKAGFQWSFFQTLWYRLLVDYKIVELKVAYRDKDHLVEKMKDKF
ncbi:glycosyltransferase family 2 protein [Vibrio alginolyticus]|uniref:glycosyltransferase family 2 protein n=1 Tax=Vibrio alginolyticus TaxID=663 RepID=UPI001BD389A5|nr:glycosyltransferase family 2 protein [Vibrio alginolyticus]MBS9854709.1 glycosyltransferase family 2 protein [Vibrio alginolyticus]